MQWLTRHFYCIGIMLLGSIAVVLIPQAAWSNDAIIFEGDPADSRLGAYIHQPAGDESIKLSALPPFLNFTVSGGFERDRQLISKLVFEFAEAAAVKLVESGVARPPFLAVYYMQEVFVDGSLNREQIEKLNLPLGLQKIIIDAGTQTQFRALGRYYGKCIPASIFRDRLKLYGSVLIIDPNLPEEDMKNCMSEVIAAAFGVNTDAFNDLALSADDRLRLIRRLISTRHGCVRVRDLRTSCLLK